MRIALAVNEVTDDVEENFVSILEMIHDAARQGVKFILFPEMCITGLINSEVAENDYRYAEPIEGEQVKKLKEVSAACHIWIGIGIFERENRRMYDTALLISPEGEIKLHYRRVQPNWHTNQADPTIYCQGNEFPLLETPFGSVMFLICGDLWDDSIRERVKNKQPDHLLYILARAFDDAEWDQQKWDKEEMGDYAERCSFIGAKTFMVNYLSKKEVGGWSPGCFGGAWVINEQGKVIHQKKLGESGLLIVDGL